MATTKGENMNNLTPEELKRLRDLHFLTWSKAGAFVALMTPQMAVEAYNDYCAELGRKYGFDPKKTTIDLETGNTNEVFGANGTRIETH